MDDASNIPNYVKSNDSPLFPLQNIFRWTYLPTSQRTWCVLQSYSDQWWWRRVYLQANKHFHWWAWPKINMTLVRMQVYRVFSWYLFDLAGHENVSFILSENFGRSSIDNALMHVSGKDVVYNFQTYAGKFTALNELLPKHTYLSSRRANFNIVFTL